MSVLYDTQLEFIKTLQQVRNPFLDGFFQFLDFFDRAEFFLLLLPVVWMVYNWKIGLRLFYILALSALINYGLKNFFTLPRPFFIDPTVGVITVSGYGFPSGGAQTAILLPLILLTYCRKAWAWVTASAFFFFVSLARLYLGVHFPIDLLGGWTVGILLWLVFIYGFPYIEKLLKTLRLRTLFMLSQIPLCLLLFFQVIPLFRLCFMISAVGLGVCICKAYRLFLQNPKSTKEAVLRALVGVIGMVAVYALASFFPTEYPLMRSFLQSFLTGLWLSLGAFYCWHLCQKSF